MGHQRIDPAALDASAVYRLLTSVVVPRPIAWVATVSADGVHNLAPHSYFNVISTDPPVVHWTSSGRKDSLRNVEATREFVVNVVDAAHLEVMNATSASAPPDVDEADHAGITMADSALVTPRRVAGAPASLECRLRHTMTVGNGTMVLGDVVAVWLDDRVADDGAADPHLLDPVGRLGSSWYLTSGGFVHLRRPVGAAVAPPRREGG